MTFSSIGASIPRGAARQATLALDRIREATRALLLEHARDHVKRTGGKLDCLLCLDAARAVHHVDEVLAGDYFV